MGRNKIYISTKLERQQLFILKPEWLRVSQTQVPAFQIELKNKYDGVRNMEDQDSKNANKLNGNIIMPLKKVAKKFEASSPVRTAKFSDETKTHKENKKSEATNNCTWESRSSRTQ